MDATQLGKMLNDSYTNAAKGEKVTMIHLFGIKCLESNIVMKSKKKEFLK